MLPWACWHQRTSSGWPSGHRLPLGTRAAPAWLSRCPPTCLQREQGFTGSPSSPARHGMAMPCQVLRQGCPLPRTRQLGPVQDGVHLVAKGGAAFAIDGRPAQPQRLGIGLHPAEVGCARASTVGHLPVDGVGLEASRGQWGFGQGQQDHPPVLPHSPWPGPRGERSPWPRRSPRPSHRLAVPCRSELLTWWAAPCLQAWQSHRVARGQDQRQSCPPQALPGAGQGGGDLHQPHLLTSHVPWLLWSHGVMGAGWDPWDSPSPMKRMMFLARRATGCNARADSSLLLAPSFQ